MIDPGVVKVGWRAVHPAHGVMTVASVAMEEAFGAVHEMVTFHGSGDLRYSIRLDMIARSKMREPIGLADLDDLAVLLARRDVRVATNFSRRFKSATDAFKQGDVYLTAGVVRDSYRRACEKTLSTAEKTLQMKAMHVLASELAVVLECDEDAARVWIIDALDRQPEQASA